MSLPVAPQKSARARVIAQSPLVVEPHRRHDHVLRRMLWGKVVGASKHGLDFVTDARVTQGEALEVSVSVPDEGPCLAGALVHVVGTRQCDGETLARCRFDHPGPATWRAAVALAG